MILAALGAATVASANHLATGRTKRAILETLGPVNNGHNCAAEFKPALPCWRVVVSGSSWATAEDVGPGNDGAAEWINVIHLIHFHWRDVGGWGEGIGFQCGKEGLSLTIASDLGIYCQPDCASTRYASDVVAQHMTCTEAEKTMTSLLESLQGDTGGREAFTYQWGRFDRRWTCSGQASTYTSWLCRAGSAVLAFVALGTPDLTCGHYYEDDDVDGFSLDMQPLATGGLTCAQVDGFVNTVYHAGLNGANNATQEYTVSGVRWLCSTESGTPGGSYYGGTYFFTCDGQPFAFTSLTQEINFGSAVPFIDVECSDATCQENAPVVNGDYGDVNDYQAAGLTLQASSSPGSYSQGPVPTAGVENKLAICVWQATPSQSGYTDFQCFNH